MQPHALNWFELPALDLARVERAGGTIFAPKMALGQFGQAAVIVDSEGNKVGLHQS